MTPSREATGEPAGWGVSIDLRRAVWAIATAAIAVFTGCASEGPLRPPTLHLPAPVRGFSAERAGDVVTLRWTTPSRTTDGASLTGKHGSGQLSAEVCRDEIASTDACIPVAHPAVTSGDPTTFADVLPPSLTMGTLRPLRYRVRILNGQGKGGDFARAETLAGAAPAAVADVRAFPVSGGAELRWKRDSAAGLRTIIRVERGQANTDTAEPGKPVLLTVDATPHDPGGAIDNGARPGVAQRYTIARTRSMVLDGTELTISSAPATAMLSASAKRSPPAPPLGLEAIAVTLGVPEISLVWQASAGAAAYNVYRAAGAAEPVLLAPVPQPSLTYTDSAAQPGVHYRYSVSAVDAQGTEGRRSAETSVTIPQP